MDRKIVMDLIVKAYRAFAPADQEAAFRESLKKMGDMNLYAFAIEMGIDLEAVRP